MFSQIIKELGRIILIIIILFFSCMEQQIPLRECYVFITKLNFIKYLRFEVAFLKSKKDKEFLIE